MGNNLVADNMGPSSFD